MPESFNESGVSKQANSPEKSEKVYYAFDHIKGGEARDRLINKFQKRKEQIESLTIKVSKSGRKNLERDYNEDLIPSYKYWQRSIELEIEELERRKDDFVPHSLSYGNIELRLSDLKMQLKRANDYVDTAIDKKKLNKLSLEEMRDKEFLAALVEYPLLESKQKMLTQAYSAFIRYQSEIESHRDFLLTLRKGSREYYMAEADLNNLKSQVARLDPSTQEWPDYEVVDFASGEVREVKRPGRTISIAQRLLAVEKIIKDYEQKNL